MRGVFFNQGLEFRLDVNGGDFVQGAPISCVLTIKNHSEVEQPLSELKPAIASGTTKKVKAKSSDAFEVVATTSAPTISSVAAKSEASLSWNFELDKNCVVTDKNLSLYFLYGNTTECAALGQLLLTVSPHPHLQSVFSTLDTVFQFVAKGVSWKDGDCIAKFKPPSSRRFSLVEELNLYCHFEDLSLVLTYAFTVKKFDTSAQSVAVKKGKTEVEQKWAPVDYIFGGGFIRQEFVEQSIEQALSVVTTEL